MTKYLDIEICAVETHHTATQKEAEIELANIFDTRNKINEPDATVLLGITLPKPKVLNRLHKSLYYWAAQTNDAIILS